MTRSITAETGRPAGSELTLIAAYARDPQGRRVIGAHGQIPWHSREDFAHFKNTTMGGTLIMGRLTWDSIGRALPGRRTIVVTRNRHWAAPGAEVAHSLSEALDLARGGDGKLFIAGGAQLYEQALPLATHQILTEVDASVTGDACYPDFDLRQWNLTRSVAEPGLAPGLTWQWWERR